MRGWRAPRIAGDVFGAHARNLVHSSCHSDGPFDEAFRNAIHARITLVVPVYAWCDWVIECSPCGVNRPDAVHSCSHCAGHDLNRTLITL